MCTLFNKLHFLRIAAYYSGFLIIRKRLISNKCLITSRTLQQYHIYWSNPDKYGWKNQMNPHHPWPRHQMETFSALLILCEGNSPVIGEFPSSPHKGQWRGDLMFSLICTWINNRETGDLRRHRAHYDVTVMPFTFSAAARIIRQGQL